MTGASSSNAGAETSSCDRLWESFSGHERSNDGLSIRRTGPISASLSGSTTRSLVKRRVSKTPAETPAGGPQQIRSSTGVPRPLWRVPKVEGEAPSPRAAHSCDLVGGHKLFIFGGWNGRRALNCLYVLNLETMTWSTVQAQNGTPSERNNHATVVVGYQLFVHGGHDGSGWLNDLHTLDCEASKREAYDEMSWTRPYINGTAPSARACHSLTRVNQKLYMFGGYDGQRCFSDVDILDLETMTWIRPAVRGTPPQARNAHSVSVIDQYLFLFGGHSGNKHLTDLHVFNVATLEWSQPLVQGTPPPGLRGHTSTLVSDCIFLFGGYDGKGRSNNLYILDALESRWIHPPAGDDVPGGRQRHSATLVSPKLLFIFGGFDGVRWLNDLHSLEVGLLIEGTLSDTSIKALAGRQLSLLGNPEYSDITFVVEGKDIHAHKCLLACHSEYFSNMFRSNMKEVTEGRVMVPNCSYNAYMSLLEYLYTGSIYQDDPKVIGEVLGLADQLDLVGLKVMCESSLRHNIDDENVCALLKEADKYQAPSLRSFCMAYLKQNKEVLLSPSIEKYFDPLTVDVLRSFTGLTTPNLARSAFTPKPTGLLTSSFSFSLRSLNKTAFAQIPRVSRWDTVSGARRRQRVSLSPSSFSVSSSSSSSLTANPINPPVSVVSTLQADSGEAPIMGGVAGMGGSNVRCSSGSGENSDDC